jgi:glycerol transport system ATP-binding protein
MAEIRIENLRHSYSATPQGEEDYALKRLSITWRDGVA